MIVYTCITNGKDQIPNIRVKEDGVSYVCFSDRYFHHPVWSYSPINKLGIDNGRRIARRYKWLSHILFPGQRTMWIDGRVTPTRRVLDLFSEYTGDICIRKHAQRSCIYHEAEQVKKLRYEDASIVDSQMDYIRAHQYPYNNGLHETGILIRQPSPNAIAFNLHVWSMISQFSMRDQLCVDFVSWLYGLTIQEMDRSCVNVGRHRVRTNHLR